MAQARDGDNSQTAADNDASRFEEGKKNSHLPNDPKDERSIANRLENATKNEEDDDAHLSKDDKLYKEDPTAVAKSHGNEPSRGAVIDKELMDEEAEYLRKKDEAKAQSEAAKKGK